MASVTPSVVAVNIATLEIEGVDASRRFDVAKGLEHELARLLTEHGVPRGLLSGAQARPPIVAAAGLTPIDLGRAVARALYEGWR